MNVFSKEFLNKASWEQSPPRTEARKNVEKNRTHVIQSRCRYRGRSLLRVLLFSSTEAEGKIVEANETPVLLSAPRRRSNPPKTPSSTGRLARPSLAALRCSAIREKPSDLAVVGVWLPSAKVNCSLLEDLGRLVPS